VQASFFLPDFCNKIGTKVPRARASECPQPAEADIRPLDGNSRFDPLRSSRGQFCCDAQQHSMMW
jgi:hypothetical protein